MQEKEKISLIKLIHDSNLKLSTCFSGAGFTFLNSFLSLEGASKSLINAEIPYSEYSLTKHFGIEKPYTTKDNTKTLAKKTLAKFEDAVSEDILMSIACIGTIKTYYEKKGEERAWLYFLTSNNQEQNIFLKFNKDLSSRSQQDEMINIVILSTIAEFIKGNYEFPIERSNEYHTIKIDSVDIVDIHTNPPNLIK
jgi:nicotinamide mononucleotide (NMN) deamidase PncC